MKKVKVINIEDKFVLILEDSDSKVYKKNIDFYDAEINIGDYIYLDDKVLEEDNIYTYGPLLEEASIEDLIKVVKDGKNIYLQRYYG